MSPGISTDRLQQLARRINAEQIARLTQQRRFSLVEILRGNFPDIFDYVKPKSGEGNGGVAPSETLMQLLDDLNTHSPGGYDYRQLYGTHAAELDDFFGVSRKRTARPKTVEEIVGSDPEYVNLLLQWSQDVMDEGTEYYLADLLYAKERDRLKMLGHEFETLRNLSKYIGQSRAREKGENSGPPKVPLLDSVIEAIKIENKEQEEMVMDAIRSVELKRLRTKFYSALKGISAEDPDYERLCREEVDSILLELLEKKDQSTNPLAKALYSDLFDDYEEINELRVHGIPDRIGKRSFPSFYQKEGIHYIASNSITFLFDDCGTGKTAQAVLAAEYMAQQDAILLGLDPLEARAKKTLIVTPNSVKETFAEKIEEYFQGKYRVGEDIIVLNGADRHQQYDKLPDAAFTIINYELVFRTDWKIEDLDEYEINEDEMEAARLQLADRSVADIRGEVRGLMAKKTNKFEIGESEVSEQTRDHLVELYAKIRNLNDQDSVLQKLKDQGYELLVVDEAQNAKGQTTYTGQAVRDLLGSIERKVVMTATPFPNGRRDLELYFYATGFDPQGRNVVDLLRNDARYVRNYISKYMLRRMTEDVLDLPPREVRSEHVTMDLATRCMYEYILDREDKLNPLQRLILLRKVALDPNLLRGTDDELLARFRENFSLDFRSRKFEVLEQKIDDYFAAVDERNRCRQVVEPEERRKVVVCTSFFKDGVTKELAERFGRKYKADYIDGDVKAIKRRGQALSDRSRKIQEFHHGDTEVLFVSLGTMKEGVDLTPASYGICLDLPYTWDEFYQFMKRLHREGQTRKVTIDVLLNDGTVDIGIDDLIADKRGYTSVILNSAGLTKTEASALKRWDKPPTDSEFISPHLRRAKSQILADMFGKGTAYAQEQLYVSEAELAEQHPSRELIERIERSRFLAISLKGDKHSVSINEWLADLIKVHGYRNVLDIGGGNGILSNYLNDTILNVDLNPFQIELAEKFSPKSRNLLANFNDIPVANGSFDTVTSSLSLHYTSEDDLYQVIGEVARALEIDGSYYIATHRNLYNEAHLDSFNANLESHFGLTFVDQYENGPHHILQYKKTSQKKGRKMKLKLFEKGAAEEQTEGVEFPPGFLESLEARARYVKRDGNCLYYPMKDSPNVVCVNTDTGWYFDMMFDEIPEEIITTGQVLD